MVEWVREVEEVVKVEGWGVVGGDWGKDVWEVWFGDVKGLVGGGDGGVGGDVGEDDGYGVG